MTNKTLGALAKDYAQAVSDQKTYRKARTELLEGIIAGKIKVAPIDFPPPIDLDEGDPTVESAITVMVPEPPSERQKPPPPPPPKETHQHWLIGSGIVALICLFVLIILFVRQDDTSTQEESSTTIQLPEQSSINVDETPIASAADNLVGEFLKQNNWSEENKQQFISNWQNLSIQEQTAALNSPAISRMSNAIYKQLNGERALLGLGDNATAIAKQQTLVDFAGQVGIDDPRLVVEGKIEEAMTTKDETPDSKLATEAEAQASVTKTETDSIPDSGTTEVPPADTNASNTVIHEQTDIPTNETEPALTTTETMVEESPKVTETVAVANDVPSTTVTKKTTTNKNACKAELAKKRKPYCRDIIDGIGNGPTLVVIRSGKFTMGGKNPFEQPAHDVTIAYPLALSVSEITFGEFQLYCEATQHPCPKQPWVGKDYPVVNVSWVDVQEYLKWLTEQTGNIYRLPSEAEWEYAARAGTKTTYPFGDEVLITDAVFSDRKQLSSPLPKTDRSINRNKFRLYHMMGNVREWVADNWQDNYSAATNDGSLYENGGQLRVVRGGSYNDNADALRSGAREKLTADTKDKFTGFRILQEISN